MNVVRRLNPGKPSQKDTTDIMSVSDHSDHQPPPLTGGTEDQFDSDDGGPRGSTSEMQPPATSAVGRKRVPIVNNPDGEIRRDAVVVFFPRVAVPVLRVERQQETHDEHDQSACFHLVMHGFVIAVLGKDAKLTSPGPREFQRRTAFR